MRYSFSAEFMRVMPPETTFAGAWESLCYCLLAAEYGASDLQRFNAPDTGIDIFWKPAKKGVQCKSDERGAFGSLSSQQSVQSLRSALKAQRTIGWESYVYATNANYTGSAVKAILEEAATLNMASGTIDFLGPDYWDELCTKHCDRVRDRFDFRLLLTEAQVVDAFRKARYYDEHVAKFESLISMGNLVLTIKNNLTPVVLELPFAPELTVEHCVDVVQELLGVSLKWTNFSDLGTSTGPSISLTVEGRGQSFREKLGDLQATIGDKDLTFWITLVWKDKTRADGSEVDLRRLHLESWSWSTGPRTTLSESQRREHTLERSRTMVETMIWNAALVLKQQAGL